MTTGNRIVLLENGEQYFPALKAAIDGAVWEIHLESYIFENDTVGSRVAGALVRAAQRGVSTHLLLAGFGSRALAPEVVADLRRSGVQVLFFRPELARWRMRRHRLRRLHRKLAVMDGQIAFVGGINIIDDMDTPGQTPPRYDFAVQLQGPLVVEIVSAVRYLWGLVAWSQLKRRNMPKWEKPAKPPCIGETRAFFLIRDNLRHRRDIENAYLAAIAGAQQEIVIANAYFLPGGRFRHALMAAAQRGVRVVLLLQGRVEYLLLHFASRALYGTLLEAGVEIHEYHHSFLHAKVAVIDGHWSTVGSSNIDPFSLLLAREANVVVENPAFASELRASLERAMNRGARRLMPLQWKKQPSHRRFFAWLSYGLVRLLMGGAGHAND